MIMNTYTYRYLFTWIFMSDLNLIITYFIRNVGLCWVTKLGCHTSLIDNKVPYSLANILQLTYLPETFAGLKLDTLVKFSNCRFEGVENYL